jgi:hypothetical protein
LRSTLSVAEYKERNRRARLKETERNQETE